MLISKKKKNGNRCEIKVNLDRYLPVRSWQWKNQSNVWNLFKVNKRDNRTPIITLFWYLCGKLCTDFTHCSVFIIDFKKVNVGLFLSFSGLFNNVEYSSRKNTKTKCMLTLKIFSQRRHLLIFLHFLKHLWKLFVTSLRIIIDKIHKTKAATGCILWKKLFLNFLQYSQEASVLGFLFNNVEDLQDCNFIKNRLQPCSFPANNAKFFKTPILKNICARLLLTKYERLPL